MSRAWIMSILVVSLTTAAAATGCSSKSSPLPANEGAKSSDGGGEPSTMTGPDRAAVAALIDQCLDMDAGLMSMAGGIFPPSDFCTLYLATCTGTNNGYGSTTDCLNGYMASSALSDGDQQHCRSYHVCNASIFDPSRVSLHCGHAAGVGLCF